MILVQKVIKYHAQNTKTLWKPWSKQHFQGNMKSSNVRKPYKTLGKLGILGKITMFRDTQIVQNHINPQENWIFWRPRGVILVPKPGARLRKTRGVLSAKSSTPPLLNSSKSVHFEAEGGGVLRNWGYMYSPTNLGLAGIRNSNNPWPSVWWSELIWVEMIWNFCG